MNESKILKTCCITGHRKIPDEKMEFVERELRREVDLALAEEETLGSVHHHWCPQREILFRLLFGT